MERAVQLAATAKAKSARVKMAPPMTAPAALRCEPESSMEHLAYPSPMASMTAPFSVANRSPWNRCLTSSREGDVWEWSAAKSDGEDEELGMVFMVYHILSVIARRICRIWASAP